MRAALLLVEAALPMGSIDDISEDRWNDNFVIAWRESAAAAGDASSLMQCQLLLEYGIRTTWYTSPGLKLMSCLPSRVHALRFPTVSGVAMRLWCLDQAIQYEKVVFPGDEVLQKKSAAGGVRASKKKKGSSGGRNGSKKKY